MKKLINDIIAWFKESNRYKHFLLAVPIGLLCNSWYMALMMGLGVGGAMDFKDKAHGGDADLIDAGMTVLGVFMVYSIQLFILTRLQVCTLF